MTEILLLHPSRRLLAKKDNLFTNESLVPSLGLASVAAYCREQGLLPRIVDLRLEHNTLESVLAAIRAKRPALVGITAFTTEITSAGVLASALKAEFPGLTVSVGGPHATILPEQTLREFPAFDAVIQGEGEQTMVELANACADGKSNFSGIAGLWIRSGEAIVSGPQRPAFEDLDKLPFPAWDLFELRHYGKVFPLGASRGCPHQCYFCTPCYLGRKIRVKKHLKIVDEMQWLHERFGAERVQFADAMLGLLKGETEQMCRELVRRGLSGKISWDCETRADAVTPQLLQAMKGAGCQWVALGVESGNERILREVVKKGENKEQIRAAVRLVKAAGLKTRCFFILGHYTETEETIKETIAFARELNPDALSFGLMVPNPGSELRRLAQEGAGGLSIMHNRWEDYQQFDFSCLQSSALPLAALKRWQSRAYFAFYSRHPFKALGLFTDGSAYNYRLSGLFGIMKMLLRNLRSKS